MKVRNVTLKKFLSVLLSICIILSLAVTVTVTADSYDIFVEAEDYARTNWKSTGGSIVQTNKDCSNGKYLNLYSAFGDIEAYYAEYEVDVKNPGTYGLDLGVTVMKKGWSSPVCASVNGGEVLKLEGKQFGTISTDRGINWYHCGTVNLNEGKNTISIIVNETISSGERAVCFLDCIGLTKKEYVLKEIVSPAPLQTFQQGEKLQFTIKGEGLAPDDMPITYDVLDFEGKYCDGGKTVMKKGATSVDFSLKSKKNGAYQIVANCNGNTILQQFLVVTNLKDRKKLDDSPFAIDALMYGMRLDNGHQLAVELADVLELSGITWARDRLYFNNYVKKNGDKYTFEMPHTKITGELLAERGIKTLQTVNFAPDNIRPSTDYGDVIATNLFDVYDLYKQLAEAYDGSVACWELLNEPDLGGGGSNKDGPDVLASFCKAAALAIMDSKTQNEVFVSAYSPAASVAHKSEHVQLMFENDIYEYCNMTNSHSHRGADEPYKTYYPLGEMIGEYEGKHVIEGPVELSKQKGYRISQWDSESGIAIPVPRTIDSDAEEQMIQARYIVTSCVEELSSGVDKRFFFTGKNYQEGDKAWGMTSRSATSPSAYAAYGTMSAMTHVLGEGVYLGKLKDVPENVLAFAFADGDDTAIIYYSTSTTGEKYDFAINTGKKSVRYFDLFANEKKLYSQNGTYSVTAECNPQYIKFTGKLSDDAFTDDYVDEYVPIGDTQKSVDDGKRVILLQQYSMSARANCRLDGYSLPEPTNSVDVEVFNFNNYAVSGVINGESAKGWTIEPASQPITIAPMSSETLHFEIIPDPFRSERDRITFYGDMSCGRTTNSVISAIGAKILNVQPKVSNGQKYLTLKVNNSSDKERTIIKSKIVANGKVSESDEVVTIQPRSVATYDIPAYFEDTDKNLVYESEIEFTDGIKATVSGETPFAVAKRKIDLSDTSDLPSFVLPDDGNIKTPYYYGKDDLYGDFYFAADEKNFYFAGKVIDNFHSAPDTGWDIWRNDSIQFSIGKGLPAPGIPYYELGMSLTDSGVSEAYYWASPDKSGHGPLEGIDCQITRDDAAKTTTYYIVIPWSVIPSVSYEDGAIAFSMLINENDGGGRNGYLEWGSGIGGTKDPTQFRAVIFDR